jgi:hypothetical protein
MNETSDLVTETSDLVTVSLNMEIAYADLKSA